MLRNLLISSIGRFRVVAFLEGTSYLILLLIAMPLKYYANQPMAVKHVGMAHGVLFILYIITLFQVMLVQKWSIWKGIIAFIASLIPFGTFILDSKISKGKF